MLLVAALMEPLPIVLMHVEHPQIVRVMECESGLQQFDSKGGLLTGKAGEIGIAQFKPDTWKMMNEMRGTNLDITNPIAQVNMIDWAFGKGLQDHWSCYKQI